MKNFIFCDERSKIVNYFRKNYAETVPFCKISTPESQVKLQYFSQYNEK